MYKFEIFKEMSMGGVTKEALIKQLIAKGIQFNDYAKILFEHKNFLVTNKIEKVKLVKVTLSDLEMVHPCSFSELINKAFNLGLKLCPLYCAAFLRLEYLEQPEGPYLTIVSERPQDDEQYPNGFYIRNFNNILWLRGYCITDFCEWPNDNAFLFLRD